MDKATAYSKEQNLRRKEDLEVNLLIGALIAVFFLSSIGLLWAVIWGPLSR